MSSGIENVGKKDVAWSYIATIFQVGAGVFLLPVILHKMSSETIGLWNVFQIVTSLVLLLDFGFRPSFARNISYVFSGVKAFKVEGVENATSDGVDYSLLKSTITAMKRFYRVIAIIVLICLLTAGTGYFMVILGKYHGDKTDAIIAWGMLCMINCYELYTYYYDALLIGKGYVKRSQQIMVLSRAAYLLMAMAFIMAGFGLVSIVASQMLSIIIRRRLSYYVFFNDEMKRLLADCSDDRSGEILRSIYPNAVKVGLTHFGGFCVNKSTILLGSAFLSLSEVAVYGISLQVMDVLTRCAQVPYMALTPKIVSARAKKDNEKLWRMYVVSSLALLAVMIVGGGMWVLLSDWIIRFIGSDTNFLPAGMLCVFLIAQLLEKNHVIAAGFIQADNRVPFFMPSLISGVATVALLWISLSYLQNGLWVLILVPAIVQLVYQNWKWPITLIKEIR